MDIILEKTQKSTVIMISKKQQFEIAMKLQTHAEGEKLKISSEGKINYSRKSCAFRDENSAMDYTRAEIISEAKEVLDELGLLPADNYEIKAKAVLKEVFGKDLSEKPTSEYIKWTVIFYHTLNGVPILSDNDEGIQITFDNQGISSLTYNWSKIENEKLSIQKTLSAQKVQSAYSIGNSKAQFANNGDGINYRQVYVYKNGISEPAWAFGDGDAFTQSVFVNTLGRPFSIDELLN